VSAAMFQRGRTEEFAARLEESAGSSGRHQERPAAGDGVDALVEVARQAAGLGRLARPRPGFREDTRAKLMERAAAELASPAERTVALAAGAVPAPARTTRSLDGVPARLRTSRTRAALLVGVAAGAVALSGMSTASGGAVPGDALYPVKRSTEKAQLALAGSDLGRGQLYLEFARTRLAEADAVREDPEAFGEVLADMDSETRLGVQLIAAAAVADRNADDLRRLTDFVTAQSRGLATLAAGTDSLAADEAAGRSADLLTRVATRASYLTTAMACLVDEAPSDELGPRPVCASSAPQQPALPPDAGAAVPPRQGPAPTPGAVAATSPAPAAVSGADTPAEPSQAPVVEVPAPPTPLPSELGVSTGTGDTVP
jgi:hypothetical protein